MLYQTGGKIGVGTALPLATLDVNGNLNLPNTTSATVGVIELGGTPFMHECCFGKGAGPAAIPTRSLAARPEISV